MFVLVFVFVFVFVFIFLFLFSIQIQFECSCPCCHVAMLGSAAVDSDATRAELRPHFASRRAGPVVVGVGVGVGAGPLCVHSNYFGVGHIKKDNCRRWRRRLQSQHLRLHKGFDLFPARPPLVAIWPLIDIAYILFIFFESFNFLIL